MLPSAPEWGKPVEKDIIFNALPESFFTESMGLGHAIHIHTNVLTHSSLVLPAPLVIPQTYYNVFSFASSSSCSSVLPFHLPCARPFQLQLDLDKDGFSFSSLFFLALAKKGFARGDYDYTHAEMRAHSQTAAWRHCV